MSHSASRSTANIKPSHRPATGTALVILVHSLSNVTWSFMALGSPNCASFSCLTRPSSYHPHILAPDDPTLPISHCLPLTEPIHLEDVLDTSILDSDPVDPATLSKPYSIMGDPETSATDDGERHLQNVSRWDRIPMGTLRVLSDTHGMRAMAQVISHMTTLFAAAHSTACDRQIEAATSLLARRRRKERVSGRAWSCPVLSYPRKWYSQTRCAGPDTHIRTSPHVIMSVRDVTATTRQTDLRLAKTVTILCAPTHTKTRHHAEIIWSSEER